jgi:succinylglutamic semialdehyde dehydrogenase
MPHFDSLEPATGTPLWQGEAADPAAVDSAVARARTAQPGWEDAGFAARAAVADAFAALVTSESEPFARLLARETGKPLWEARTEVGSVAAKVAISRTAHAERTPDKQGTDASGGTALTHRPHGVLAVLGPFNFPAHLPNGHIVPALLAGNAVVFKPSELTPAVAEHYAALWARAGLPDGVLNVVQGLADTGRALASHPGIDGLLFTGSSRTGAALARQFAETPHRVLALEMGGNNPLVVWHGADPEAAARVIVQSAYLSAGQRCTAARRLVVPDNWDGLDALLAAMDRLRIGAPFDDPQPFLGPVIANAAADTLLHSFAELPGRVLRPLARPHAGLPFLTPALVDVTGESVPDEELFGPVLQLVRVPDFGAAVRAASATRFGLAASLVGGDDSDWAAFRRGVRVGVLNRNRPTNGAASAAPFGGAGASGNHRPSAYYAADYCAWPVASMISEAPTAPTVPGLA